MHTTCIRSACFRLFYSACFSVHYSNKITWVTYVIYNLHTKQTTKGKTEEVFQCMLWKWRMKKFCYYCPLCPGNLRLCLEPFLPIYYSFFYQNSCFDPLWSPSCKIFTLHYFVATGYGLDDQAVRVQVPLEARFSLLHVVQTGSGAHPASYLMGRGGGLFHWG
jgi:hypothetical protein